MRERNEAVSRSARLLLQYRLCVSRLASSRVCVLWWMVCVRSLEALRAEFARQRAEFSRFDLLFPVTNSCVVGGCSESSPDSAVSVRSCVSQRANGADEGGQAARA